ncbi:hypothetical protein CDAR_242641 [Caerostris darwini]|uniref:Ribosomal protein L2 n=1 Tax=Caerostris darwini TaxID=1538125 RepID=A0AAV4N076_9ARAC|nr:hypothetical protein CDAR_242641 [Caerostris darwini]
MQFDTKHAKRKLHFLTFTIHANELINIFHQPKTGHSISLQFHPPKRDHRPYHGEICFERIPRSKRGIIALSNRKTVLGTHSGGSSILKEGRLFISNKKGGRNPIKSGMGAQKRRGGAEKSQQLVLMLH